WVRPGAVLAAILPLAAIGATVAAYNLAIFGNLTGVYGAMMAGRADTALATHLYGLLFSPGRGLLVYFPVAVLVLVWLCAGPLAFRASFAIASLSGVVLVTLLTASWPVWWGGHCFGPRLLSETEPLILLALGTALAASARPRLRRGVLAALLVLLPVQ